MIPSFNFARIPHIIFGPGKLKELFPIIPTFGKNVLIVTGSNSLKNSGKWQELQNSFIGLGINYYHIEIKGEPSPNLIDNAVQKFRELKIDLIIGIGGGSVTDAGKAISGMILKNDSITNYLEGVGTKSHDGQKIPYIAIPTTSGTGSEATKNAVISKIGPKGFKKSLRHDNLIPNIAIIDPELTISCPSSVTAACGLDAFTQLLESYVSSNSNPITDSLAFSGMNYIKDALIPVCSYGASDINARSAMAYGSLLSGITLANAGLGIVHGLASPIGGTFDIPHGVVCGTILSEATKINIQKLQEEKDSIRKKGLQKYAEIGALLSDSPFLIDDMKEYLSSLIETLEKWTETLKLNRLSDYGVKYKDIENLVEKAGLKNNPADLNKTEIAKILKNRL